MTSRPKVQIAHHVRQPHLAATPGRRDRGVAMVELAFVAMLLFGLSAVAVDYGLGWRAGLAVTEATRTGVRVGSALGPQKTTNGREADYYALSGAKSALTASGKIGQVQRVVVFKSNASGVISAACKTGVGDSSCSIISGANFRTNWDTQPYLNVTNTSGCLLIASPANYCPTTRVNYPQGSSEYLGIYIQIRHPYLFPMLGSGVDVGRTSVMRIEPRSE